jgi:hypothetical protein
MISFLSALLGATTECRFGDGAAVSQPTAQDVLTCTPPAAVGAGAVSALLHSDVTYADSQIFSYAPKKTGGRGLVSVAALAYGADGGCAHGFVPDNATARDALIYSYLHRAGASGADLVVLPENAFGRPGMIHPGCVHPAEPVDGPLVQSVSKIAAQYQMNVVLPIHESRGDKFFNTAVVLDRQGRTVGTYSKVFPVFGNTSGHGAHGEIEAPDSVWPSSAGVKAFDLDFGRIAVLICFDINFAELWQQAEALGTDLVVWPSAMVTPDPSTLGYARIHQYDIVAVGFPGDLVGRDGTSLKNSTDPGYPMRRAAVRLQPRRRRAGPRRGVRGGVREGGGGASGVVLLLRFIMHRVRPLALTPDRRTRPRPASPRAASPPGRRRPRRRRRRRARTRRPARR